MKRLWLILFALPLFAQNETLAIIDFESNGVPKSDSKNIVSKIESEIAELGVFTLVERNQIEEVLTEQGFQQSGCTSNECAVEIGKLLGTDKLLLGSIGKTGKLYTINARIVSAESGAVLKADEVSSEINIEDLYKNKTRELAYIISGLRYPIETFTSTTSSNPLTSRTTPTLTKEEKEEMARAKKRFDLFLGSSGLIIGAIITISGLTEPKQTIPVMNISTGQTSEKETGLKDSAKNKMTSGVLLMIGSSYYLWDTQLD